MSDYLSEPEKVLVQQVQEMMQLAINSLNSDRPVDALRIAEKASSMGVNVPEMHYLRSLCLSNVGRHKEALAAAQAELLLNPNHAKAQAQVDNLTIILCKSETKIPTQERTWNTTLSYDILLSIQKASMTHSYRGIPLLKNPFDLAIYPVLIWNLKPRTIIEIGSKDGGSALWFGDILNNFAIDGHIYSIDIVKVTSLTHPRVTFMEGNGRALSETLTSEFLNSLPHPLLVIEDADHAYETSKNVLEFFHPYLKKEEYIVVEDGIISDLMQDPSYTSGPHLALKEFLAKYQDQYEIDSSYCDYFGYNITWCTNGFLKKLTDSPESNKFIYGLKLREINLIAFPDWQQPEDLLYFELERVISSLLNHYDKNKIALLFDTTNISEEDANLTLSAVAINLLMEAEIEETDIPEIILMPKISSRQWSDLLPQIHGRIVLENENKPAILQAGAENISIWKLDS
ncbi:CmcI family methyltransferase [[Phormidium] sp. LEGE 05292]|uniref:CmcI family methyltransferase n=1 Tax=[Phormidium] sp. LEGE 05292 TaxID=767427 RepID=UPI001D15D4A2|nr:CmcI family methyltransferase [Phormidium sp. LEGE 05292]